MVSPSAARGDVEDYMKNKERERTPKDKKKGRKLYTVGKKLSAIAKFDECGGKLQETAELTRCL